MPGSSCGSITLPRMSATQADRNRGAARGEKFLNTAYGGQNLIRVDDTEDMADSG